jgi:hypothetical protein
MDDTYFEFMDCVNIVKSTGRTAFSLRELRETIAEISNESLFHHTCQYFLGDHVLEYANDFAQWVGETLEERALSERLSSADLFDLRDMDSLRRELTGIIDKHIAQYPETRRAMTGDEFCFTETISIAFPIGIRATNLAEFLAAVRYLNPGSIYYHFYEARIRHGSDDFSSWIEDVVGKRSLSAAVRSLDPFMHTIDGIRSHIVEMVEAQIKLEMEEVIIS